MKYRIVFLMLFMLFTFGSLAAVAQDAQLGNRPSEPPKWGIGRVVIRDRSGKILSTGVASSYGPATGTITDPEQAP